MSTRRVALYIGGASLLVAWLSSAASVPPRQAGPPAENLSGPPDPVEHLAADVRAEVRRLKERLADAPRPAPMMRNPFTFGAANPVPGTPVAASRHAGTAGAFAAAVEPAEPDLSLIGLAEHRRDGTSVRTAMIAGGPDELIMAVPGDTIVGRYTVTAIGAQSVDLTDTLTGRSRRLVLP